MKISTVVWTVAGLAVVGGAVWYFTRPKAAQPTVVQQTVQPGVTNVASAPATNEFDTLSSVAGALGDIGTKLVGSKGFQDWLSSSDAGKAANTAADTGVEKV